MKSKEMFMERNIILMITVFITSSMGAVVRILHESEKKTLKRSTIFFIYFAALSIGYISYEISNNFELTKWIGLFGIVGGLASVDIVTLIIEKAPALIMKWFGNKINLDVELEKKEKENGANN